MRPLFAPPGLFYFVLQKHGKSRSHAENPKMLLLLANHFLRILSSPHRNRHRFFQSGSQIIYNNQRHIIHNEECRSDLGCCLVISHLLLAREPFLDVHLQKNKKCSGLDDQVSRLLDSIQIDAKEPNPKETLAQDEYDPRGRVPIRHHFTHDVAVYDVYVYGFREAVQIDVN